MGGVQSNAEKFKTSDAIQAKLLAQCKDDDIVVVVKLSSCHGLKRISGRKPNGYVLLSLGDVTKSSLRRLKQYHPVWEPEELFMFRPKQIRREKLLVSVQSWTGVTWLPRYCSECTLDIPLGDALVKLSDVFETEHKRMKCNLDLRSPEDGKKNGGTCSIEVIIVRAAEARLMRDLFVFEFERKGVGADSFHAGNLFKRSSIFNAKDPKHFGRLNGESFDEFDEATPNIPPETSESDWTEWHYNTGMKTTDAKGWQYANSWKGPWSYLPSATTFVRRRKWVRSYNSKYQERDRTESQFSGTSSVNDNPVSREDEKSSIVVVTDDDLEELLPS